MYGCVRECDFDSMADMVCYGDRVYCVACCDSVSKILYLHFHIPGLVCVGVPFQCGYGFHLNLQIISSYITELLLLNTGMYSSCLC